MEQEEVVLDSRNPKIQQVLAKSLAIAQSCGLHEVLLQSFNEVLVDQILDALCVQYLGYMVNEERIPGDRIEEQLSLELVDRHARFFSMALRFYSNENPLCKHPVSLDDLDFGPDYSRDMDVIKFVILLINKHGISDLVYEASDGNEDEQLQRVLTYAFGYIQDCASKDGSFSILNVLVNQHLLTDVLDGLKKGNDQKGDLANG